MKTVLTLLFLFAFPWLVSADFTRTLSVGSEGEDVRELQKLLNRDPITRVASSGPGSPGQESTYFGALTNQAVKKFQQKYAPEVLFPADTWIPTGIVGQFTRAKLNTLLTSVIGSVSLASSSESGYSMLGLPVPALPSPADSLILPNKIQAKPQILSVSQFKVNQGTRITVLGEAFHASENTIHFSQTPYLVENVVSSDGRTLVFTIPADLPYGSYNMWVSNMYGSSFNETFGNYLEVVNIPQQLPRILSVEPKSMSIIEDQTITIHGEFFDQRGNKIFSTLGAIENLPSPDRKTIEIKLADFPGLTQFVSASDKTMLGYSLNVILQVQTQVGFSSQQATVHLDI